ncbi:ABC transporter permease [Bifidobacterium magnum]|uniref:ABC transporter, permease n=1 Tax=Bifidobacterium magnum TaxID=1692 RepID=A0A087BAP9_9BIFI|nr:ABC transporter permease [Bifidobacterium magnum]KFI68099.1 ABC transporter, permease [Bifidobacterium magnum]
MKRASVTDTLRAWRHSVKPFMSLVVITLLGVLVLTGIYAGCQDAFRAANAYYTAQHLHDIEVASSSGITNDDLEDIRKTAGVASAVGQRTQPVTFTADEKTEDGMLTALTSMDRPYVTQGALPKHDGEVAVTRQFIKTMGLSVGESFTVKSEIPAATLAMMAAAGMAPGQPEQMETSSRLKITGIVMPADDLTNPDGYMSQNGLARSDTTSETATFYVPAEALSGDVYSSALVRVQGVEDMSTFSADYEDTVNRVVHELSTGHTWFVQDRASLSGYSAFKSDISSIESIGNAFPIVFLVVAVMMSLTTMTRLVEEDRLVIGTYSGLGYNGRQIISRYVMFAVCACLLGGVLGDVAGFFGLPAFLLVVIHGMYAIPNISLHVMWPLALAGIALFVLGIGAAAFGVAWGEVRQLPAVLMRPKSPKAGTRILLERITPIWKRMKFLNKVTARNMFRFKSRLIMTVGGVAGCTALILCGLAINDTVNSLGERQYGEIDRYSVMALSTDADAAQLWDSVHDNATTQSMLKAHVEAATLSANGSTKVQLIVIPDDELNELNSMVSQEAVDTRSTWRQLQDWIRGNKDGATQVQAGQQVTLNTSEIIVPQSAANSLGIHAGERVGLENGQGTVAHIRVQAVTRNLIGASVFISEHAYNRLFPSDTASASTQDALAWNAVYAKIDGTPDECIDYADQLAHESFVLSATSTNKQARDFSFDLMGAVVAIIVGLAGGLALVVLFTLSQTNVAERTREIATLKVLGFTDREVHHYVNREMMMLTLMGIVIGLPVGYWVSGMLTSALNMPGIYFAVQVNALSYVIAAAATLVFALLVQLFVNPVLDKIDPVSSLKSVE